MSFTWDQWFMIILVVAVFFSLVKEWLPAELIALSALFACICAGILPIQAKSAEDIPFEALRVFSHPAPLTIACMFVVSAALERTGVIERLGVWFEQKAAKKESVMLLSLIIFAATLSAFINNTPVVVIFMPIIIGICKRKKWKATRYLIPLSYAAIVGGTITIVGTSTNLIASGIAEAKGLRAFNLFEIAPLGIVFVLITAVYLMTIGRRLLPDRLTLAALVNSDDQRQFMTRAIVKEGSDLIGKTVKLALGSVRTARVVEVFREGNKRIGAMNEMTLEEGDEIVVKGDLQALVKVGNTEGIKFTNEAEMGLEEVRTEATTIMEGIIGPNSSFIGKSLKDTRFRNQYGVIVVALHRQGKNITKKIGEVKLQFGDTLLVQGAPHRMQRLFSSQNFVSLSEPQMEMTRPKKAKYALTAMGGFVLLGAAGGFGWIPALPVFGMAFGAALACLLCGCLTPKEAYEAVEWKVIFMIMGMLGLGLGLEKTNLAAEGANTMLSLFNTGEEMNPVIIVGAFYLLAAVLTELISNQAVAALLTPIAISVGIQLGIDPRAFVVAVMFGSSASFTTPIGYQTNTLVYGGGGYKFSDFFKVGFPLAVILWIVASFLIPIKWKLAPLILEHPVIQ